MKKSDFVINSDFTINNPLDTIERGVKSLLAAILVRAVLDSLNDNVEAKWARSARIWLRSDRMYLDKRGASFFYICDELSLNPETVRTNVAALEAQGENIKAPSLSYTRLFDLLSRTLGE